MYLVIENYIKTKTWYHGAFHSAISTQRWMSGVICNSSKIERESLRVGGETCYGVCFLYSTTNKKIQEAEVDVTNWKNNIMLYCIFFTLLYSFILNYFDYLLSSFFQFLFCGFFFFLGGTFYFAGSSFIFILLIGAQLKLRLL